MTPGEILFGVYGFVLHNGALFAASAGRSQRCPKNATQSRPCTPLPLNYQPVVRIVLICSTGTKSSDTDAASAQLEKNARQSAFLAADQKNQIKELISTLPLP